jgi:hypothetical protein
VEGSGHGHMEGPMEATINFSQYSRRPQDPNGEPPEYMSNDLPLEPTCSVEPAVA